MSSRPSRGAARLAAILDALPDGLLLVNCNGTVVNANSIALDAFETPGTALVGRGLLDLLPQFDSRLIPGSMRRPEGADERGRTKPTRMLARRTDGAEFPVEVTSASLEDGREAYDSYGGGFTGDELLMLVVRDLSGTVDTEAELARSQRQTEMILRAASEGVVGTDTDGRVVLVNPSVAQILGFRASDLGGKELHPLVQHSRGDGEPFPYEESALADTLRSGRKHRVRGQVLWAKDGSAVPVDLTTAPVRDGEQLVGAVLTFADRRPYEKQAKQHADELRAKDERNSAAAEQHAAELTALKEQHAAELTALEERHAAESKARDERHDALAGRHEQLTAVLGDALRGPLEELRAELGTLAADPAGQLWPEANQILHHLAAGYSRMTTLVDSVLGFQRLDAGTEELAKTKVMLDAVVAAGVDGAVELIGPGRVQFAVHAPPIEAEVDAARLATALAHLIADVAGVDATGKARVAPGGAYVDSTIVVAAAQRGEVVRIEVRGPFSGGDAVHEPIVRGIVRVHGGVLQTHEVPGTTGSAYVLEVPLGAGAGTVDPAAEAAPVPAQQNTTSGGGRRRGRRSSTDAFLDGPVDGGTAPGAGPGTPEPPTGRRRARREEAGPGTDGRGTDSTGAGDGTGAGGTGAGAPLPQASLPAGAPAPENGPSDSGSGRRRGRTELPAPAEGSVVTAAENAQGTAQGPVRAQRGATVPPQGVPSDAHAPSGRRARRAEGMREIENARPALSPAPTAGTPDAPGTPGASGASGASAPGSPAPEAPAPQPLPDARPAPQPLPLPLPEPAQQQAPSQAQSPSQPQTPPPGRRARRALATASVAAPAEAERPRSAFALPPAEADRVPSAPSDASLPGRHDSVRTGSTDTGRRPQHHPGAGDEQANDGTLYASPEGWPSVTEPAALPPEDGAPASRPLPAEEPLPADASQGRAISVRTLGQGTPFTEQIAAHQNQPHSLGSGRRRRLAAPPEDERPEVDARPHPQGANQRTANPEGAQPQQAPSPQQAQQRLSPHSSQEEGRSYAIGAPDEGSEGPEPLDGPGGAVEVANRPQPQPIDDELPPEPLDNPRRLLVWPAPDVSTQQALSDRGYRPVIVNSREEVDAQIAAFPAALFVDPLTGPITRKALQSLRQAAVAAEVPVLVTAGLGQATREAAYGADPAVLLKALAPRDSEQHPSRVLLIEEHEEIALALTETLERRGMQVVRAATDAEAVTSAAQMRPNLVVMDLMQVRRRRAGIVDWLRANGQLNRTPLVVYTSAGMDEAELPRLASGETVLFLAERSTSSEVQGRIVDLLAKIGTN
ncbi:hybrid sensor histidine kinase/response regulator [Streptomyces sp. NBC_01766]|uniref:hybrid sensor histidine kinase/response regulator n=1 Tax=Streptomyces sp. NBC_01766 TaxID=2975936 RepID=UPI002DD868B5|nr:PAS domain-containing protein [Streptomyces sp. NBC_01766]WSC20991.1 PAS domain-containing protein [Streptomyces sp. NBC_01766]